ncbi:MAG TPA: adenylate/guanylate cyclase domain-containing protein, partial [Syntrophales bacterium]|nr:adenylate/guanylate cyclase domain-containing protein [Syntrophales bacterium]
MKCPKCHFNNRKGARFCLKCGDIIELRCPQCSKVLPLIAKFCDNCGQRLDEHSEEKIIAVTESGRKRVSVLYSDLSGYSSIAEILDPEDLKEIMGEIFGEISEIVSKYDGFVEKFVGDAVMAIFGVPVAHEDDPVRAIRAARNIHKIIELLGNRYEEKIRRGLTMHTGICTGLVVTGEVSLETGIHGVLGETINIASRLSVLAKPGEIIVDHDTCRRAEGHFIFEDLEPINVNGKTEPVKTYRVLSSRRMPAKIHRLSGMKADLIGRKAEMAQLQEAASNLKNGKGAVCSIIGDAGTGKSRLIEEFKAALNL